ncbi:MAG: response regulator [Sphingobacteriaceae bacterium]
MRSNVELSLIEKNTQRKRRILCIDDEPVNCMVLNHILSPLNFHVDLASNGLSGLALMHQNPYDLVLLDICMAEMNGFQTAAAIREIKEYTPFIVFISAGIHDDLEIQMKNLQISNFLPKPIDKNALTNVINQLL